MTARARMVPAGLLCGLALGASVVPTPAQPPVPPPGQPSARPGQDPDDGVEVLARGPVHEAYAAAYDGQPAATPVVPRAPPDPVEEFPPDQKPEGDNVQ